MQSDLRIYIEPRGHGARGPRYQVRMNKPDGMVIIDSTTEPLFDAARVLMSNGITGRLEMWDGTRPFPRMRGDIVKLAAKTVSEGDAGICLRRYAERAASGDFREHGSDESQTETGRPWGVLQTPEAMEAA